jgi:alpha-tubulin suppressor-like RCC1 family protein
VCAHERGGVACWGRNHLGQLGDGTITDRTTLVDVRGLASGMSALAAGSDHTCAVTSGGGIKCWGSNDEGQLGDGGTTTRYTPVAVRGLASGVVALAAGGTTLSYSPSSAHTCAVTSGGGVKCWGANHYGQLGDGTTAHRTVPVDVSGLATGVVALAASGVHTCALTGGGGVKCWGANSFGQLGDGTTTNRLTPVDVSGLASGVVALAAGGYHTCALTSGGGVKCWGANYYRQLGDGTTTTRTTPVDVSGLASGVSTLAAGYESTCAGPSAGGVRCWGGNVTNPFEIGGLASGVVALVAGGHHICALTSGGGAKCAGWNDYGQLGDGTTTLRWTALDVSGLVSSVSALAASWSHTCAATTGGGVKCWGHNGLGQLGDGTTTDRLTPADVSGLTSGVSTLAASWSHTCAVTTGGGVKCWGDNGYGQLGVNPGWTPVDVVGFGAQPMHPVFLPLMSRGE